MLRLWITRTENAAKRLQQSIAQEDEKNIELTCQALIEVEPLSPWQYSEARLQSGQLSWQKLDDLPASCCVLVLSVTAARCYVDSHVVQAEQPHIAVGEATAVVLREQGLQVDVPRLQNSEGLTQLDWPRWLDPTGWVWVIAGLGGRELIAQQLLQQFKTRVCKIATYQRTNVEYGPLSRDELSQIDAIEISSLQALNNLYRLYPESRSKQLVVPSLRLKRQAQKANFKNIVVAESANAADIVKSLHR